MLAKIYENYACILFSMIFLLIGLFFGIIIASGKDKEIELISEKFGRITISGKNIRDYDLSNIDGATAAVLVDKISKLSPETEFSKGLKRLKSKREGPFETVELNVEVRFVNKDFSDIPQFQAATCGRNILFGKMYQLYSSESQGMLGVLVIHEIFDPTICSNLDKQVIWVREEDASDWLKPVTNELPNHILVTAREADEIIGL